MSQSISTLLSAAAPCALMFGLWVMAQISRRFGEVTHRPPLYRYLYGSLALMVPPVFVRLLAMGQSRADLATLGGNHIEALLHDGPMVLGIGVALVVAWRYWGWLIDARPEQPVSPKQ